MLSVVVPLYCSDILSAMETIKFIRYDMRATMKFFKPCSGTELN